VKELKAVALEKLGIADKADKVKVFNYFACARPCSLYCV
jgi:hypothetical protein